MSAGRLLPYLIPVPFFLLGGGCYCLVAEVDTLTCDRSAGVCTASRTTPLRATTQSFAVEDLKGAELGSGWKPGGTGKPSKGKRILLTTNGEPIPFMGYTTELSMREMEEQAAEVRRYVASATTRRLEIRRDNRTSSLLIAAIPFGLGVALLVSVIRVQRSTEPAAGREGQQGGRETPPIEPT